VVAEIFEVDPVGRRKKTIAAQKTAAPLPSDKGAAVFLIDAMFLHRV
jgi:hypothetical protein